MRSDSILRPVPSHRGGFLTLAMRFACVAVAGMLSLLASCTSERYDSGDGSNSYLTAELALVNTSADGSVRSATLDDGAVVTFSNPFIVDWAQKPDTAYRALVYYDRTSDDMANVPMKARSVVSVPVLAAVDASRVQNIRTDALGIESVWLSANGRYVNLSLLLKAGKTSGDDAVQTVGIVSYGVQTASDGSRTLRLTLYHDQGNVPEYYTVQRYVSIDSNLFKDADHAELTVNTYNGVQKFDLLKIE